MKKWQIGYFGGLALFIAFLIVAHTFSLLSATIDNNTIFLLILLILLPVIPDLKLLKWGDLEAQLTTKDIEKVEKEISEMKPMRTTARDKAWAETQRELKKIETRLFELAKIDTRIALIELRVILEKLIRDMYLISVRIKDKHEGKKNTGVATTTMIKSLSKNADDKKYMALAQKVLKLCNKGIHTNALPFSEAVYMIKLGLIVITYCYGYIWGYSDAKHKPAEFLEEIKEMAKGNA